MVYAIWTHPLNTMAINAIWNKCQKNKVTRKNN